MPGAWSIFQPSGTSTEMCTRSALIVGWWRTCNVYQPSCNASLPSRLASTFFDVLANTSAYNDTTLWPCSRLGATTWKLPSIPASTNCSGE